MLSPDPNAVMVPLGFDAMLDNIKSGFSNVIKAVDAGLALYASVPGRIEALREINADIKQKATAPVAPVQPDTVTEFFKKNSGFVTIAAVSVLIILAVRD